MFRNKLDEIGKVVRNKARLVAKGYSQKKELATVLYIYTLLYDTE